jgi:hypothetical protein
MRERSMRAAWPTALLLSAVLGFFACAPKAPRDELAFSSQVAPQPPRVGRIDVAITLHDRAGKPVDDAQLSLEGNMSHAGMVPVLGTLKSHGNGAYLGTLELTMAGDWVVHVAGALPSGDPFERTFTLHGVLAQ